MKGPPAEPGMQTTVGHTYGFGTRAPDPRAPSSGSALVRNPARWASSAPELPAWLRKRRSNE
eukprot:12029783-Alexandrium_andersonii.AAC.1